MFLLILFSLTFEPLVDLEEGVILFDYKSPEPVCMDGKGYSREDLKFTVLEFSKDYLGDAWDSGIDWESMRWGFAVIGTCYMNVSLVPTVEDHRLCRRQAVRDSENHLVFSFDARGIFEVDQQYEVIFWAEPARHPVVEIGPAYEVISAPDDFEAPGFDLGEDAC